MRGGSGGKCPYEMVDQAVIVAQTRFYEVVFEPSASEVSRRR